ncbi:MAG: AAA family ATPase [Alphaproteobacteria bacterium]|nr:AAA family ATPase [Alphaproteobacteria bacterium]
MSQENDSNRKSTLTAMLPQAHVHVFSAEEHTQDVVSSLSGDWRFGRVSLEVKGNTIDEAIALYSGSKSPTVVIVQTSDTGQEFREKLDKLASCCAEGTSALVIGPVNDVQLYRALTNIGVSDYLVHPVSLYDMAEAISRTLLSQLGASHSHLIAVVGSKGGVGTTNIAHLVASICSDVLGQKCILIDAAAGHSTLWAQFGYSPTGTLVEAAKAAIDRDHDTLSRILMAVSENLTFLNTGAEPMLANTSQQKLFEMFLERMLGQYPVVIADLSATSPSIQSSLLARANGVLVVTTPTVNALSLTRTLIKEILAIRGQETDTTKLVINRRGEAAALEVPEKDISEAVGYPIATTISYAPKHFLKCESEGVRPSEGADGQKLMQQLQGLIAGFLGLDLASATTEAQTKGGFLPGFLKKLSS